MALNLPGGPGISGFDDIKLVHCALPDLNLQDVDTSCSLFNKRLMAPIMINAITGGAKDLDKINGALARIARNCGIAMAVGSQTAALRNKEVLHTFKIVREVNPDGLIFANVGAHVTPGQANAVIEMISADALQVHLNVAQELVMPEGDRDFEGYLENIVRISEAVQVPVIVKEVGFGLSFEAASKLKQIGINNIDIGGVGGTNFMAIEQQRNTNALEELDCESFLDWGIPTAASIIETTSRQTWEHVFATGGIRNALHCIKALALGADLVGVAGLFLRILLEESESQLQQKIEKFKHELRLLMILTGAKKHIDLKKIPVVVTGFTNQWLQERGFDTKKYARRSIN